jgi:Spy/CpxP family protein refolding chaperone
MFRRSAIALSLAGVLATTGLALAQDAQPKMRHAHGMARMQQRLGLTDDQVNGIKTVFEKHREQSRQAWESLHAAQTELRQLALNGGDTTAKTAEVQKLMAQTVAMRVQVLQDIGPLLTPEQRAKFAQATFHPGMRHHHRRAPVQS